MTKKEIRREIKTLANKCIYLNKMDFIDVAYTHFEKMGIFDYKSIDNAINEFINDIIIKNN